VRSELGARCRHGFVAPEGKILYDADLAQIEARTFAHLSRDPKLCQIFIDSAKLHGDEKKLRDIHIITAAEMFSCSIPNVSKSQRQAAKAVIFGVINGITYKGLFNQMILSHATRDDGERWTEDDCAMMIAEWFKIYPKAKQFQVDCVSEANATGLTRDPLSGRIRHIPQIWSPNKTVREEAERVSYAHKVQTSANTILRRAMKGIWDVLKGEDGVTLTLVVHDETLFELPDKEETRDLVEEVTMWALTQTTRLLVPVEAEGGFGPDWGTAH
jgi:DNA polymerase-1